MKKDISKDEDLQDKKVVNEKDEKDENKTKINIEDDENSTEKNKENIKKDKSENEKNNENDTKKDNEKSKVDEKTTEVEVNNPQNFEPKRIKIPLIWIILFLIISISCIIIGAIYFLPLNK